MIEKINTMLKKIKTYKQFIFDGKTTNSEIELEVLLCFCL